MLNWFLSWFRPRDSFEVYAPKERLIYEYFDGRKQVKADPMVLWKRVMDRAAGIDADRKALDFPTSKFYRPSYDNLIKQIREIFQVKGLEEGGLTEPECIDLVDHFTTFVGRIKKKSNRPAISPPNTLGQGDSSSVPAVPTTEPSLDSGSAVVESSTVEPNPLPSEPELLSESIPD